MKTSEILRGCLVNLQSGNDMYNFTNGRSYTPYVCIALLHFAEEQGLKAKDRRKIASVRRVIDNALGDCATVTDWLAMKGYDTRYATREEIQDYRKKWVRTLAQQYEVKGD